MLRKAKIIQPPSHGYALKSPMPIFMIGITTLRGSRTKRRIVNFQENDLSTENMTATIG